MWPSFFNLMVVSIFPVFSACLPLTPFFSSTVSQYDGCLDVPVWVLMAGLQGILAMGAFYSLGAS